MNNEIIPLRQSPFCQAHICQSCQQNNGEIFLSEFHHLPLQLAIPEQHKMSVVNELIKKLEFEASPKEEANSCGRVTPRARWCRAACEQRRECLAGCFARW